uniref:START domain-containing protein n=1 Tax=Globisporangium ultimum (strain ATCC 200006 / CBS 805.95 / DAOM BR144) TaxID=431595 RepID=K3W9J2_GLOUD
MTDAFASFATDEVMDENLLLAETEELLEALDATAFAASPISTEDEEDDSQSTDSMSETHGSLPNTPTRALLQGTAEESPSATALVTQPPNPQQKKKRVRARDKTKDELLELRKNVVELEQQLVALRRNSTIVGKEQQVIARTWQNMAARQLRGRQRAEAENEQLKAMLLGQLSLTSRFDQTSNKRQLVALPSDESDPSQKKKRFCLADEDRIVMDDLIDGLDKAYARMDDVFRENGMDQWQHETKSFAKTRTFASSSGEESTYLELLDVRLIPFNVYAVGNFLWQSVKDWHHKNDPYSYPCVDRPNDTFAVSYRVKASGKQEGRYSANFKLVKRRYIKDDQMVLMWKSRSDGENDLAGLYTDETGWLVVKSVPSSDSAQPPTTALHACVHIVPRKSPRSPTKHEGEHSSKELTNLVISTFEDDVNSINISMENLLLENARSISATIAKKEPEEECSIHFTAVE